MHEANIGPGAGRRRSALMSRVKPAPLGALLIACLAAPPALAATDPVTEQATRLIREKHAMEAYTLLAPLTDTHAADADFDYTLGLAALDSGHTAEAIIALQRALALRPQFGQARAEIARAYAVSGDIDTARKQFDTVAGDPTIPDPVRQRFGALVHRFDKVNRPGLVVSGYGEAGAGYDGNVNAATSQAQLVIPLLSYLGPATLSGAATRQGDGFASFEGGLSLDYGFDRHSHVFVSGLGSGHVNFHQSDFSQAIDVGTVGYAYTAANRDVLSLSGQYQRFWLGGASYRRGLGAIAQYSRALGDSRTLSLSGQFFDILYPTDRLRDARRFSGNLTYADGGFLATLEGGTEDTKAGATRNLSNYFYGARVAIEHRLDQKLALFGNGAVERRDYRAPDTLFLIDRRDTQLDLAGGLRVRLTPRLIGTAQGGYTHNFSNITLNRYDRITGTVSVRFEF